MTDLEELVRPNIRKLKPYHSARADFEQGLLLDANENSQGAPGKNLQGLNRYPSPGQELLRQKIAAFRNVKPENVFVGNGSDEAIDLLYRIFCRPGQDRVLTTPPTYGMYRVTADIHDITVDEVLLDEHFQPRVDTILDQADEKAKMLFLCSPNNPTGNLFDREKVDHLIENFPGIVVIDEAYIDFSEQESYAPKVNDHPNLVVMQTMSKSFGLAGIRLGMAFASKPIINYLMKVKPPYNVNALTSKAAIEAFDHLDAINQNMQRIKKERRRLRNELATLEGVQHIYESEANFLLVKIDQAKNIYRALAERGIIVRYRGDEPRCENGLRITVGTEDENNELLNALKSLLP